MSDDKYYDSQLNWENLKEGTCFVETEFGDVIYIKKKTESKSGNEIVVVDKYDNDDVKDNLKAGMPLVMRNRKISYDGWLVMGYADWEYRKIDPALFNRMVMKALIRKHIDDTPSGDDIL